MNANELTALAADLSDVADQMMETGCHPEQIAKIRGAAMAAMQAATSQLD